MLGYVIGKPRRRDDGPPDEFALPPDLRRRLRAWLDIDAVGQEGLWIWFRAILPLLPQPDAKDRRSLLSLGAPREELRRLQQRIVVYAREQSRLTVLCNQCVRDNELLARRLRALEGALRAVELAGQRVVIPEDPDAEDASGRYLPAVGARGRRAAPGRDPSGR